MKRPGSGLVGKRRLVALLGRPLLEALLVFAVWPHVLRAQPGPGPLRSQCTDCKEMEEREGGVVIGSISVLDRLFRWDTKFCVTRLPRLFTIPTRNSENVGVTWSETVSNFYPKYFKILLLANFIAVPRLLIFHLVKTLVSFWKIRSKEHSKLDLTLRVNVHGNAAGS